VGSTAFSKLNVARFSQGLVGTLALPNEILTLRGTEYLTDARDLNHTEAFLSFGLAASMARLTK
jgi:hypothetical protein